MKQRATKLERSKREHVLSDCSDLPSIVKDNLSTIEGRYKSDAQSVLQGEPMQVDSADSDNDSHEEAINEPSGTNVSHAEDRSMSNRSPPHAAALALGTNVMNTTAKAAHKSRQAKSGKASKKASKAAAAEALAEGATAAASTSGADVRTSSRRRKSPRRHTPDQETQAEKAARLHKDKMDKVFSYDVAQATDVKALGKLLDKIIECRNVETQAKNVEVVNKLNHHLACAEARINLLESQQA